jgi:hypothetical protein
LTVLHCISERAAVCADDEGCRKTGMKKPLSWWSYKKKGPLFLCNGLFNYSKIQHFALMYDEAAHSRFGRTGFPEM